MINGILFLKQNELKLISFFTEKLIPINIKSLKQLDIVRSRFTKQNLLLCNFREHKENIEIHPIHFVQLKTKADNKLFDIGKLSLDEIVTLAYKGAILLQQNMKKVDELEEPELINALESGFD